MIRKNGENGYILLDAVIISFLLLALSSGMYFLKINSINRINCIQSINADYIAQYYLDRMVYLNTFNSKCTIVSGGVYYTVQERVKNIIAYNEYAPNSIGEVTVSWKTNKKEHHVTLQRKWRR